ncbi:MAG: YncE family protein [Bacillota bacterium]|nr:YncE family protein [Bacillota bacterium]
MKKYLTALFTTLLFFTLILAGCGNQNSKSEKIKKGDISLINIGNCFIFTANEGGSISKISVKNLKVVDNYKIDGMVHNIQVSPNGKIVGATVIPSMTMNMKGKAIFFNPISNKIIKEVEVGNHPAHLVFTNDGKYAVVTNNEDNNISVIDMKSFQVIKKIPTGKGPHGFRISNDSQFAYVANMGENSISVINLSTLKEEKEIQVGDTPVTTGITSDGKTLVVTLNKENALAIIDLDSGKIDKVKVGEGPAQVFIQSDNQFAYVANQGSEKNPSHTLSKVDLKTKKVVATIETGKGSHGVVTSPDTKFTYVTNMFDNTVSVIDNSKNTVVKTIHVGKTPNGISIMP